jgi:uroporphyrin-III C-methyltransferase
MVQISLLTSIDSTGHIHLEVGAKPLLIAPETAELHYALQKRIDNGEVEWLKKGFEDDDVLRLGREEINGVVDAVFVTSGPRDPLSMEPPHNNEIS